MVRYFFCGMSSGCVMPPLYFAMVKKTASTEFVYSHYNDGRLFSQGQAGDIVLIKTSSAASNRNVNHAGSGNLSVIEPWLL